MKRVFMQNMVVYKRKHRFDNLYMRHNASSENRFQACKVWANWNYFVEYRIL